MFLAWCDEKQRNVIIGPTYIRGLANTEHGITLSYVCDCGEPGQMVTKAGANRTLSGHATSATPASKAPTAA